MGYLDGIGKHLRPRRRKTGMGIGISSDGETHRRPQGFDEMAAEADATRIRLSDHVHTNVSRLPPSKVNDADTGPASHPMPADKPDPRAQWDGARGVWILWDTTRDAWIDLDSST